MKNIISCISIVLGVLFANNTIAQNLIPHWEFVNEVDKQNYLVEFSTDDGNMYGVAGTGMLKYDSKGKQVWRQTVVTKGIVQLLAKAKTTNDEFYAFYYSNSKTINIGPFTIDNPTGEYNGIICKLDSSANVIWVKNFDYVYNGDVVLSADGDDNIYLSSSFKGQVIIDNSKVETEEIPAFNSRPEVFLAKFNNSGNLLWLKNIGQVYLSYSNVRRARIMISGLAFNTDNSKLYLTGTYDGDTLNFHPKTLVDTTTALDPFLVELDSNGNTNWIKRIENGIYSDVKALNIKTDNEGNIILYWYLLYTNTSTPLTIICKYNRVGDRISYTEISGTEEKSVFGFEIDDFHNIYIGLNFKKSKIQILSRKFKLFEPIPPKIEIGNSDSRNSDMCLLKYDSAFNLIWYKHVINKGDDIGSVLIGDKNNSIYISGITSNTFNGSDSSWFGNHAFYFNNNSDQYFFLTKINSCVYPPLNLIKNNTVLEAPDTWESWEWYVDGERIENVNWYSYAPKKSGTYTAGTRETNGCLRLTEPYTWIMTGVDDVSSYAQHLSIYPNPANKAFTLRTPELVNRISIYTIGGQLVKNVPTNQKGEYKIDIPNSGLYFIKVTTPQGYIIDKVVIW